MNPFNVDDRGLLDASRHPHMSTATTTSNSQYFDARTIPTSTAPNFTTVNSNFYLNLQSRDPLHGPPLAPGPLDNYPQSPYEAANSAAKEERRRRNTAASARFRQKKKQKEEAMETRMARVQERNSELEQRVNQLELENKWLKDLITEKNGKPASESNDRDDHDENEASLREWTANGTGTSVTDDGDASL